MEKRKVLTEQNADGNHPFSDLIIIEAVPEKQESVVRDCLATYGRKWVPFSFYPKKQNKNN